MSSDRKVDLRQVPVVPRGDACGDEIAEKAFEQLVQNLRTPGQQRVSLRPLGNSAPSHRFVDKHIPFDHRHRPIEVGQRPGGE
jgi:hypothetical protein